MDFDPNETCETFEVLLCTRAAGGAIPVACVAGLALIALGITCWPGPPLVGMLTYCALVTLYLAYLGLIGGLVGVLLWPAVVLHVILTALLACDLTRMLSDLRKWADDGARHAYFRLWHKAEIARCLTRVRKARHTGRHANSPCGVREMGARSPRR